MSRLIYILIFLSTISLSAQIKITNSNGEKISDLSKSKIEVDDIDGDGSMDSLYYDFNNNSIICLLSSRQFEPLSIEYFPENCMAEIEVKNSVLYLYESFMRNFDKYMYCYDKNERTFRLVCYTNESLGNAVNDGSGTLMMNLLTEEFIADWNYYNSELDSLIAIPTIKLKITNSPIFISDSNTVVIPIDSIFSCYKYIYESKCPLKNKIQTK